MKFLVAFLSLFLSALVLPAQTDVPIFDDQSVQEIRLEVEPSVWQTLRDNYLSDTYYPADFYWSGHPIARIGIRSRGSGSRSPHKPNLLLAFDRYVGGQQFFGLPSLILKANNQDASLMRELISMRVFRQAGLAAPLEAPARLYVNGQFFGAYTVVEVIDEAFLRRNYGEDSGYLYEWEEDRNNGYRFEYLGSDPALYSPARWSPKNHRTNPDPAPLEAMVRAVNFAPDEDFVASVSEYLDLNQFVTYIAVESFMADFDGFLGGVFGMNNFYFYRFAGTTRSHFLPWDKDNSFELAEREILDGVEANVLARRALAVPELRKTYLDTLLMLSDFAGGPGGWLEREIDRLYYEIRDMARWDPNKQCSSAGLVHPCGADEFEIDAEHLRQFAWYRAAFVNLEVANIRELR